MERPFPRFGRLRFAVSALTSLLMTAAPAKAAALLTLPGMIWMQLAPQFSVPQRPRYEALWRESAAPDGRRSTGI